MDTKFKNSVKKYVAFFYFKESIVEFQFERFLVYGSRLPPSPPPNHHHTMVNTSRGVIVLYYQIPTLILVQPFLSKQTKIYTHSFLELSHYSTTVCNKLPNLSKYSFNQSFVPLYYQFSHFIISKVRSCSLLYLVSCGLHTNY